MRILHVSMGIPPFRVGGLNEYCLELMEQQVIDGHSVALLYPGEFGISKSVKIIETHSYYFNNINDSDNSNKHNKEENTNLMINMYKIKNPLPLALIFGINDPIRYMVECDKKIYMDFISTYNPDIIHIHCIQGIHKEFFEAAYILKKKMVFTTHDYYPICPKCSLYNKDFGVCDEVSSERCAICNANTGLSKIQEIIMQSKLYEKLKYNKIIKKIRGNSRSKVAESSQNMNSLNTISEFNLDQNKINMYKDLSDYYESIMNKIDLVHCNSFLSQSIYKKYYPNLEYCVLPITRKDLGYDKVKSDNKLQKSTSIQENKNNSVDRKKFIIGFVGGLNPSKGLGTLIDAVLQIEKIEQLDWELHLYGGDYLFEQKLDSRILNCGFYNNKTRDKIYSSFDVLVVPSLWPETFGFIVPEALSVGTPVICSSLVGSKDYIQEDCNLSRIEKDNKFVFEPGNSKELAEKIIDIAKNKYSIITKKIETMEEHSKKVKEKIYL